MPFAWAIPSTATTYLPSRLFSVSESAADKALPGRYAPSSPSVTAGSGLNNSRSFERNPPPDDSPRLPEEVVSSPP
eukprot:CAMPEP_0113534284 /NCGR_PEP_ID=MMETSP0015_2-20120614/5079_1 /TAXON_ID=2838 /ORGANISM="Odontella" /LENGTH=75 /DNA_ID=CAMNT_0000433439 /DNA_START=353 /DNA_END=576 /DNA_ORIENTATION=+ /assembly_acc=CAM_ASM_000160